MSANSLSVPFPIFNDIDGDPLDAGYIYIGTANLDPVTNPISVYFDEALTIPATQPIRTLNGFPSNSGSPVRLYISADDYSITVKNKNGSQVYTSAVSTLAVASGSVNYTQGSTGSVQRTLTSKLQETVSILDFDGVDPTGATDSTAAIQAALDSGAGVVLLPAGTYKVTSTLTITDTILRGVSKDHTIINCTTSSFFANINVTASTYMHGIEDFTLNAENGVYTRWPPGTVYETNANPTRTTNIRGIKFIGTYDPTTDVNAGSITPPTLSALEADGVALSMVFIYGGEVTQCDFENYGVGIEAIGGAFTEYHNNRFINNARHIHSTRETWSGSTFGLGQDKRFFGNDILDGHRHGSVYLLNDFGTKFHDNYMENLDRTAASADCMLSINDCESCSIVRNHFNTSLSVVSANPFLEYVETASPTFSYVGGNEITGNYVTPGANREDATVSFTTKFEKDNPISVIYHSNEKGFPEVKAAGVVGSVVTSDYFAYDNMKFSMDISGTLSLNKDMWAGGGSEPFYLKTNNENLVLNLSVDNPRKLTSMVLEFEVDDNATSNGRLYIAVDETDGTNVFTGYAFQGVLSPTTIRKTISGFTAEAHKTINLDMTRADLCKIISVRLIPAMENWGSLTYDPPSLADGAGATATVTCTGAVLGDFTEASFSNDLQGITVTSWVSAADTVKVRFQNETGGVLDLASGTLRVVSKRRNS